MLQSCTNTLIPAHRALTKTKMKAVKMFGKRLWKNVISSQQTAPESQQTCAHHHHHHRHHHHHHHHLFRACRSWHVHITGRCLNIDATEFETVCQNKYTYNARKHKFREECSASRIKSSPLKLSHQPVKVKPIIELLYVQRHLQAYMPVQLCIFDWVSPLNGKHY